MIISGKSQLLWLYLNEDNIIGRWFFSDSEIEKITDRDSNEAPMMRPNNRGY